MSLPADTPSQIRVLHVDDDKYQLEALVEFFKLLDPMIHVNSVSSPIEALKIIEKSRFDCIVTDYKMPEKNGLELSSEIRARSNIPIIIYTGQGSEEIAEKAFSIGINDYIKKEIDPSHYQLLTKRIRDVVEKNRLETLYHTVVEDSSDALAIIVGTNVVFANKSLAEMLGVESPKDLIGKSGVPWSVPEKRKEVGERMKSILNGRIDPILREYDLIKKNGQKITVETSTKVIDYKGQKALLIFVRDITARRDAEEARRRSEDRFQSLVNLAPDAIVTMNLMGQITFVNSSFCKLSGYTEEDVLGKSFFRLSTMRPTDIARNLKKFSEIIIGKGTTDPVDFKWIRKDGEQRWAEAHVNLIPGLKSQKEVIGIIRDSTEQKMMFEKLEKYSKKLENLVEERTHKLLETERMAATGKITAMVGHDLRGPLNTIKNASYLIRVKPEKIQDMLTIIDQAVDRSVSMLDDLRNQAKEISLDVESVEIAPLLNKIISELPRPPRITMHTNLVNAHLTLDKQKIQRVIENLIRNAIDAIPNKGDIYISTDIQSDGILISVKDTGGGIPKDVMNRLFQPFVTTKEKGTGLGLLYCKNAVEAHGGKISVRTAKGKGTTFDISLPLEYSPDKEIRTVSQIVEERETRRVD